MTTNVYLKVAEAIYNYAQEWWEMPDVDVWKQRESWINKRGKTMQT